MIRRRGCRAVRRQAYGMTRRAAPARRRTARSSPSAPTAAGPRDGRPPAELHPLGLEGPLGWLAEQLEAGDEEQLEWLWDLAPNDLPRLARYIAAYERRYPRSERTARFRARLTLAQRRKRGGRGRAAGRRPWCWSPASRVTMYGVINARWRSRPRRQCRAGRPQRWAELLAWHPSLPLFWPAGPRSGGATRNGSSRPPPFRSPTAPPRPISTARSRA